MSVPLAAGLTVPTVIGESKIVLDRARLVRYAGASGDFNPIHWSGEFAEAVGLPGVIGHGMLTMGAAIDVVEQWLGDPAAVLDYQTRFSRPVPVPVTGTVTVDVVGTLAVVDPAAKTGRVDLTVTLDGVKVLVKAQVTVRLG